MATLADVLTGITTKLQASVVVDGGPLALVMDHRPEQPPDPTTQLPAAYLIPRAPSVIYGSMNAWQLVWPIDVLVLNKYRGGDLGDDLPSMYGAPESVIAALLALRTMDGALSQSIGFADPAVGDTDNEPFGLFAWKEKTYVGTLVHSICTIKRSGGL